jgi:hypothetical protein
MLVGVGVLSLPKVTVSLPLRSIGAHKPLIFKLSVLRYRERVRDKSHSRQPVFLKPRIVTTATSA